MNNCGEAGLIIASVNHGLSTEGPDLYGHSVFFVCFRIFEDTLAFSAFSMKPCNGTILRVQCSIAQYLIT